MLEDVFAIQENIAENVATALKGYLSNKEKDSIKRPETSFAAYEFFLKGRQFMHRLLLDDAKQMFEKALTLDPDYAPACAGLADVHSWLYEWYGSKLHDLVAAKKNAAKALSLAPNLSESHTSNGYVLSLAKEYERAEQAFQTAIQMNPNSFDAFYFYGRLSFAMGKIEQSADLFMKASAVQPEDFQSVLLLAQSLRILNRPDWMEVAREGITRARKQLELNPEDRRALSLTSINLLETGNREEGKEWAEKALSLYPDDVGVLINSVCFYARYGDKQKALDLIEIVFGKGFGKKDWIEHDPDYDSLGDEPRFIELLNKLQ